MRFARSASSSSATLAGPRRLVTANPAFRVLPLDLDQATQFALLDAVDDVFDRLIIAAARATRATLLSADHAIAASGLVEVRWE
jgi:PIN domain nuclease of toxin-antitoxin system